MPPLISKIRCNNPNKKSSAIRNHNLLIYIGTREGVDLSLSHLQDTIQQATEDMNMEIAIEEELSQVDKINFSETDNTGINGLFGNVDSSDIHALANEVAQLTRSGKLIYNGVVSLTEADALRLGFDHKTAWTNSMAAVIPDIAKEFQIPVEQLKWTAAVHMEAGHPHCHYMFWRDDAKIRSPFIHTSVQDRCRMHLSKEFYAADREAATIAKTLARDSALQFSKEELDNISQYLNASKKIPGRFTGEEQTVLHGKMESLIAALPVKGRITYKLVPPEVKVLVNDIVTDLSSRPDIKKELSKYYKSVNNISESYSANQVKSEINLTHAKNDINTRLGNCVLATAKTIRSEFIKLQKEENNSNYRKQQEVKMGTAACYSLLSNFMNIIASSTKANKMANPFDKPTKTPKKAKNKAQSIKER